MQPEPDLPKAIQSKLSGEIKQLVLCDVNAAASDLGLRTQEILELAEIGLLIVFDISTKPHSKREFRILKKSIEMLIASRGKKFPDMVWPEILKLVLPDEKPELRGVQIQRILNCSEAHVINLIEARELQIVERSTYGRGPDGSPRIQTNSFIDFLKRRLE